MLHRLRTWLDRRFERPGPRFVVHDGYRESVPVGPYDPERPLRIATYLQRQGLAGRGMISRPRPASLKRLALVHDAAYLHALEDASALEPILGLPVDAATGDRFLAVQRLMCGGTLRATHHALLSGATAMNLGGGFHHAQRDRGSGFCAFNDVAVAIASLRRRGFAAPILVVDLDLHDGDGTRAIFADDPTVHTFSIHNHDLGTAAATASTSVALGSGVDDSAYLAALHVHLPPVVRAFKPGLVYYLAGADPALDDHLGDWRVTLGGLLARDRFVLGLLKEECGCPVVVVLAGGYGPQAWRHGAALGSWLVSGSSALEVPVDLELPVHRYRDLFRMLRLGPGRQRERASDDDWGLTHDDVAGVLGAAETRFLGRYSRHGIELALEESGLLDRLRGRGYRDLRLDLDLADPLGHLLRITSEDGPAPVVLFEVRLRIDRAVLPGMTMLVVEWLLIQDAGGRYEMTRPLLPGQRHPGMGLLRDTAAMLIVVCERLELDGIAYTPSHYHLARMSHPAGRFADPEREGRYLAVARAVGHLPLDEAAAAVHGGRLVDARSGEAIGWDPALVVLPVSDGLRRRLEDPARKQQEARAAGHWHPRLRSAGAAPEEDGDGRRPRS
ncbi:MAG TPA: histone deacetylase [Candidatus Krumholzibacteria bacterium]|nr:histone deacetylase [Candidatus Krumholzibacteria bacterium]